MIPHNFLGPVLTAASVHVMTSIPNFTVQEYSKVDEEQAVAFPGTLHARGRLHPGAGGTGPGRQAWTRRSWPRSARTGSTRRPAAPQRRLGRVLGLDRQRLPERASGAELGR